MGKSTYKWSFCNVGGMSRIKIDKGEDLKHLGELDQKLWTVLSCPASGLEFNARALEILDCDKDGRIHANEVIAAANLLTGALKDSNSILRGENSIALDLFNEKDANGAELKASADKVFELLGEKKQSVSLEEIDSALKILADKAGEDAKNEGVFPYGDNSDAVLDAVKAIKAKVDDYFIRCSLVEFNNASLEKLDVSAERIGLLAEKDTNNCWDEIASYPLTQLSKDGLLPMNQPVNPAWAVQFNTLKEMAVAIDYPGALSIDKARWNAIEARVGEYAAWKEEIAKNASSFNEAKQADAQAIGKLADFVVLYEHFYHFLRNYVTFNDFYSRKSDMKSMFQAGELYIDQRCCELCIKVNDMGKQLESAELSGMFLVYCKCVNKLTGADMMIAAAVTNGDLNNLRPGKNGLFYDRQGNDWDATITNIIINPISIKQAFWMPYKRLWNWITEKLNNSAKEKEEASVSSLISNTETVSANVAEGQAPAPKAPFDIAKFAGIFAAIGLALGFIASAVTGLLDYLKTPWFAPFLFIIGIIVVISGPSMFLAWTKLRKRNLAPILNANGWALNAAALIKIKFGATLTTEAVYPKLQLIDPEVAKKMRRNRRKRIFWFITIIVVILAIVFAWLWFTGRICSIWCWMQELPGRFRF